MKDYGEPLHVDNEAIIDRHGEIIGYAARERMVACANACSGLNPEGIPGLIEVAEVCAAASKWDNRLAPFYCEKVLQDALAAVKEKP